MHVYLNYKCYGLVIPYATLSAMGKPAYIYPLINKVENSVLLIPRKTIIRGRAAGSKASGGGGKATAVSFVGSWHIPRKVYEERAAYAAWCDYALTEQLFFLADVSGASTYLVPCRVAEQTKLTPAMIPNLPRTVNPSGVLIHLEMMEAESIEAGEIKGTLIANGGYVVG